MTGRVTILGSGTSTGVPTLNCPCAVCHSADPRDQRLRPSIWIQLGDGGDARHLVVDTTPDFRAQALRAGIPALDAVLFTHGHADHIMGMDDIRPFNFRRPDPLPAYADAATAAALRRVFKYVFDGTVGVSAIPRIDLHTLSADGPLTAPVPPLDLFGARIEPLPVQHGSLPVLGYRFGANAYITDFSEIPPATMARLHDLDVLILDALRLRPHPTHSNLENSLRLVEQLRPRRAYFTHIAHELPHAATQARLPAGVALAYDGLSLDVEV